MRSHELLRHLRRRATRLGVNHERPGKGGHLKVRHGGRPTVIPMHSRDLPTGTFRTILQQLALTEQDLKD